MGKKINKIKYFSYINNNNKLALDIHTKKIRENNSYRKKIKQFFRNKKLIFSYKKKKHLN